MRMMLVSLLAWLIEAVIVGFLIIKGDFLAVTISGVTLTMTSACSTWCAWQVDKVREGRESQHETN